MARGGKREGAGRPKGSRSAATKKEIATLSDLAKMHTKDALDVLVKIAKEGESESARVTAANSILDRAYGKPQQAMDHTSSDGSMALPNIIVIEAVDDEGDDQTPQKAGSAIQ